MEAIARASFCVPAPFCVEWCAMNVGLSDADLAPRIAAGDREAEAEMCRRMGPRIRLYGLRHLRSPSAADDLVQQVLLKIIEALRAARLREPDKLAQFVLGTCRMTVLELRRSSYRQEELLATFGGISCQTHLRCPGWTTVSWPAAFRPSRSANAPSS